MVIKDRVSNETAARAYSQQGHGKTLKPIQRPDIHVMRDYGKYERDQAPADSVETLNG